MSVDPFYSFLALVTQDAHAVATSKKIAEHFHQQEALMHTLAQLQATLSDAQIQAHNAKKALDAQELTIKMLKDRQRSLSSKRDASSSLKEYHALEAELKTVAYDIDTQENKLFELFEKFERLEKNRAEIDFNVVTKRAQTMSEIADLDQKIKHLQLQLNEYKISYDQLTYQVNPEMLEKFLTMKQSLENPVVVVEKNACSACFNTVSAQELVSMRKHKLVACQNCFRLLYAVPSNPL